MTIDEQKLEAFVHQAIGDLGAAISACLIHIGDKLGLYKAMAGAGPLTPGELAKITREQLGAIRPVWETGLVNPDFAAYAELCGARGFSVRTGDELRPALDAAFAVTGGPSLVEVHASARDV